MDEFDDNTGPKDQEARIDHLVQDFDAIEARIPILRAQLRRSLLYWTVGVVTIVGLALDGGLGYTLSWVLGLTAFLGVASLPRVNRLRALEWEREQLLLEGETTQTGGEEA